MEIMLIYYIISIEAGIILSISDLMNKPIFVGNDHLLAVTKNINGAGVMSGNRNLIGIISKTDIIKTLAYS